jgi:hypothetical protein
MRIFSTFLSMFCMTFSVFCMAIAKATRGRKARNTRSWVVLKRPQNIVFFNSVRYEQCGHKLSSPSLGAKSSTFWKHLGQSFLRHKGQLGPWWHVPLTTSGQKLAVSKLSIYSNYRIMFILMLIAMSVGQVWDC